MDNLRVLDEEVLYSNLEPGVINREMINKAFRENGFKGEAGRLQMLQEIDYEKIFVLLLEFKNILRIDFLWILPNLTKLTLSFNKIEVIENIEMLVNLKQLDLSFNYIERIENLDSLVHLEELSLCNNLIRKIENLDNLENLIILSLANNQIESIQGIERFRFLEKLKVLNLEGNPIATENNLRSYVAAILPNLSYYAYVFLTKEERETSLDKYRLELREIVTAEQTEREERETRAREIQNQMELSSSFTEYLDEHQLFDSFWKDNDDGYALRQIGEEAEELIKEYRTDIFNVTQEIYKLGIEKYKERQKEIEIFSECIRESQSDSQKKGQYLVEQFLVFKDEAVRTASAHYRKIENAAMEGADDQSSGMRQCNEDVEMICEAFDARIDEVWQQLMEAELHLNEMMEETTTNFSRTIQEMTAKFVEEAQNYFVQLRDIASNFSDSLIDAVSHYIAIFQATGQFDKVAPELRDCLDDKNAILNLIDGMRDIHMQRIDAREDRLVTRSNDWLNSLMQKINKEENERNRLKIVEINYFLEQMREDFGNLQTDIREQVIKNQ